MLDFIGQDKDVPLIAALNPAKVAGYVTGSGGIAWSLQEWDMFPESRTGRVRIDQTPTLAPFAQGNAEVADVENGAGTITEFAVAAKARKLKGLRSAIYIQSSNANNAHAYFTQQGIISDVDWWIADWNLSETQAATEIGKNNVVAVQWASPTSNPNTLVPGSKLTLAQAGVDLSVALEAWFPPVPVAVPTTVVPDVVGLSTSAAVTELEGKGLVAGSHSDQVGTVNGQTPGGGKVVARGSTVNLSVAVTTPPPNVITVDVKLASKDGGKTWEVS
jgi:hypothetical protein